MNRREPWPAQKPSGQANGSAAGLGPSGFALVNPRPQRVGVHIAAISGQIRESSP